MEGILITLLALVMLLVAYNGYLHGKQLKEAKEKHSNLEAELVQLKEENLAIQTEFSAINENLTSLNRFAKEAR
ncbi:MAG: hypothetical protein FWF59_07845 [Turicibacter sp.]|nr:hypothetical protein [Turicibacter sp.]